MDKTAVEWLAIQLYEKMNMSGDGQVFDKLLEQAKQMEREQTSKAMHHALDEDGHNGVWRQQFVNNYINKLYDQVH